MQCQRLHPCDTRTKVRKGLFQCLNWIGRAKATRDDQSAHCSVKSTCKGVRMNIFQSFQPNKQKQLAASSQNAVHDTVQTVVVVKPISSLKALLLNLDNDPLTLSVSNSVGDDADAKSQAAKAKLAHMPTKATARISLQDLSTMNPALYKHIAIEANFDITPLLSNVHTAESGQCYTYPHNRRLAENYTLSDFVNRNLSKTRHWTMQESDLPYFNSALLGSITSAASVGTGLMLGGPSTGVVSSGQAAGPPEYEAALQATQSRMLKWQDALYSLLREFYAHTVSGAHSAGAGEAGGSGESGMFYVLGRSLLVPATTSNSAATNNGSMVSLPYTSAVFYHINRADHSPSTSSSKGKSTTHTIEPACLLIGVHKSTLTRLQQLGAQCSLVEDLAHPWTSANSAAPTSASAAINVNSTRGSIDPHASTSALLNNKKVGINLVLTGRFSVSVAAEVLLESVFAFVHSSGRPSTFDVPILMAHRRFPHAVHMAWDKRPVQCEHKFFPNKRDDGADSNVGAFHKVHLQGLITATSLPKLIEDLHKLSKITSVTSTTATSTSGAQAKKRPISSAYDYLRQKEGSLEKLASSADLRNLPNAVPVLPLTSTMPPPAQAPVVNPMTLLTTASVKYVAEESGNEGDSEGESENEGGDSAGEQGSGAGETSVSGSAGAGARKTASAISGLDTTLAKRKLGSSDASESTKDSKAALKTSDTTSNGELRAESWLKARRAETAPYFLIQLSVLTPRCVQMAYAHRSARRVDGVAGGGEEQVGVVTEEGEYLLQAEPLIDEIRWQGTENDSKNARFAKVSEFVEVVTTTQPALRARLLQPPKSKSVNSHHDPDHIEEMEEHGVVLDALNKYSIFVASKPM